MPKSVDKLQRLRIYVAVVEGGSFNSAAIKLNLKPPTVSRAVQLLEEDLKSRLLVRTTRSLTVSDIGQRYYEQAKAILHSLDALDNETRQAEGMPRGQLKITAPVSFGEHVLGPLIPEFLHAYPEVSLELDLSGDVRDLKRDGFDVGIRNGKLGGELGFYYLPIRSLTPTLVASPKYAQAHGLPSSPSELSDHIFVLHRGGRRLFNRWTFSKKGESNVRFEATSRCICNHIQNGIEAAKQGLGIVNTYVFYVEQALRDGSLVRVLPDYQQPDVERFAYYHQRRAASAKLDVFLTFLEEKIGIHSIESDQKID